MMDETVIQEIANQLGMGVDKAGDFIAANLPQYAALRLWSDVSMLVLLLFITVVLGIAAALLYRHHAALETKGKWSDFDEYAEWAGVAGSLFLIAFVIAAILMIPEIIGWACFPEAQLIREAMNMLGR